MPGFKKTNARPPFVPRPRPPAHEVRQAPQMPGKTLASKLIKPVGAAIALLIYTLASAQPQVITAPQGNQAACPYQGCKDEVGRIVVTEPPYSVSSGSGDMSGRIQMAIDALRDQGGGILYFPPGTYHAQNVVYRAPFIHIMGAGQGATTIIGDGTNLFLQRITNPFTSLQGPTLALEISDLTLKATNASLNLVAVNGREVARAYFHDMAVDLSATGDTQGFNLSGTADMLLDHIACYSSVPGHGKCFVFTNSPAKPTVRNSTCDWVYTCAEWGTGGTAGATFDTVGVMLGWHALPAKFANSGATVSYTDGVLTDTAATFAGLCNDNGAAAPQTCTGNLGNMVRVMTPIVTAAGGTVNFNSGGNVLTDAAQNFTTAGVTEGDLIRTGPICRGGLPAKKEICTGGFGTGSWGDRCECTTNADCDSGVCEPRFTWVNQVMSATTLRLHEWMSDTDRRPVTAPSSPPYTVYSWVVCSVGSFTTQTLSCAATTGTHFKKWDLGTVVTPAAQTRYEVMTRHPNYPFLEQSAASSSRIVNSSTNWSFSDNFFTTGDQPTLIGNRAENCWDHCYNLQGNRGRFTNNLARKFGARGVANFSPNSVMSDTIGMDGPLTATGVSNCPIVIGLSVAQQVKSTNSQAINTVTLANSTSGICIQNTSDGVTVDNATCVGTFTTSCIHVGAATNVNTHIENYHGETIVGTGGTFALEGGKATQAQITATAAQNGSYVGCADCTVANPCAGAGTGALAKRQGGAWVCN